MAPESVTLRVLLITGTVGSGKTSVLLEIGEALGRDGRPYAIVDLDWLAWLRPSAQSGATVQGVLIENLAHVAGTFRAAGVERLALARAVRRRRRGRGDPRLARPVRAHRCAPGCRARGDRTAARGSRLGGPAGRASRRGRRLRGRGRGCRHRRSRRRDGRSRDRVRRAGGARQRRLAGVQVNGVVVVTAMKPSRSRIGRLSSDASTCR